MKLQDIEEPQAVSVAIAAPAEYTRKLADFYAVTKPRMNFLVVVTTVVGFYVAAGVAGATTADWRLVHALIGTTLTAAAASVFNQILERNFDARMRRTRNRPLASGRMSPIDAAIFGSMMCVAGVVYLAATVNLLTAALGLATLVLYVFVYTPLKRLSPLCTVVGAIPGAIPPVMGVTAFYNEINVLALSLFGLLFVWQMPHFFALALMYKDDYAAGGFRMLPLEENGPARTRRAIVVYTIALVAVSFTPLLVNGFGVIYAAAAAVLGLFFLKNAFDVARKTGPGVERKLFLYSILYLPAILAALMIEV